MVHLPKAASWFTIGIDGLLGQDVQNYFYIFLHVFQMSDHSLKMVPRSYTSHGSTRPCSDCFVSSHCCRVAAGHMGITLWM